MKLAWFSPLPPQHSEIANFSARLSQDLRARFEARFFYEDATGFHDDSTGMEYPVRLGGISHPLLLELNRVDVPVYHLGNNPTFFSHTWFLSQAKPGIVVLHDLKLHHFFEGIYRERLHDQAAYLQVMKKYYGALGYEAGMAYWRQEISIDFMAQHFPLTAHAVRGALGILVHTAHALAFIQKVTEVPVIHLPLAHEPQLADDAAGANPSGPAGPGASDPRRLIIFGHLNVNRRVVEFLTAVAAMPERDRFEVHIFGRMLHEREVETAVEALGLRAGVKLHGFVSEEALVAGLRQADLAINLRYPTMGEASASQLRIWDHALPSLVTLTDGYAELPPDAVFFVRPERETEDIQRHLRELLVNPDLFRQAGQRGRRWLESQHSPAAYVERLGELCLAIDELRSRHNQLRLADRVGASIAPWIDATPATAREAHYAAAILETV